MGDDANPVPTVPLAPLPDPGTDAETAARAFYEFACTRRSVRAFSDRAVSLTTIEWLVRCAASAPSGANKQPWRFVAVSDPALKARIRAGAEEEERAFYGGRASDRWIRDLEPYGTDPSKPYLEVAPWLVVVFRLMHADDGGLVYYAAESAGIAVGLFLMAAHHAGLATLVHTPSPMRFLGEILGRPPHERPFALIPVGYPAPDCRVPAAALARRPLDGTLIVDPRP